MNLGGVIKSLRQEAGMSQKELALACGITPPYLSQVERNHRIPLVETIETIAKHLNVPAFMLFVLAAEKKDVEVGKHEAFAELYPKLKRSLREMFPVNPDADEAW